MGGDTIVNGVPPRAKEPSSSERHAIVLEPCIWWRRLEVGGWGMWSPAVDTHNEQYPEGQAAFQGQRLLVYRVLHPPPHPQP